MKRASKAEEALSRQVKLLKLRLEREMLELNQQEVKIETLRNVIMGLESEIDRSLAAREKASERQKKAT